MVQNLGHFDHPQTPTPGNHPLYSQDFDPKGGGVPRSLSPDVMLHQRIRISKCQELSIIIYIVSSLNLCVTCPLNDLTFSPPQAKFFDVSNWQIL